MNLPSPPPSSPPPPSFCSRLYLSIMSYYNSLLPKQNGNPAPLWMPSLRGLYGCPSPLPSPLHSSPPFLPLLNTEFDGDCTISRSVADCGRPIAGQKYRQFTPERGFWEYETRFTTIVTKESSLAFWLWSKGSIRIFRFNFFSLV